MRPMENLPTANQVLARRKKYIQKGVNYFPTKKYQENFAKRMLQDFAALKADFVDRIEADRKFWLEKKIMEDDLRVKGLTQPLARLRSDLGKGDGVQDGQSDTLQADTDNAEDDNGDNQTAKEASFAFRVEVEKCNPKKEEEIIRNLKIDEKLFEDARQLVQFGLPGELQFEDSVGMSEKEQARKEAASNFKLWRSSSSLATRPMSGEYHIRLLCD